MQTEKYYVIKPTTHCRKKVTFGDELALTEAQARPLRNGGFVTPDKVVAQRVAELVKESLSLKTEPNKSNAQTEPTSEAE